MSKNSLPPDYRLVEIVDLEKNKKEAVGVNALGFVLSILTLVVGFLWKGLNLLGLVDPLGWLCSLVVTIVGFIAYIYLHELTHGLFIYVFSKKSPHFGVKLPLYVYAGGKAYFSKGHYILIALAPVLLWGVVFLLIGAFLNGPWFWCLCFLQAGNIGGAAGDIFVAVKTAMYDRSVLVFDTGVRMEFYLPERKVGAMTNRRK